MPHRMKEVENKNVEMWKEPVQIYWLIKIAKFILLKGQTLKILEFYIF